MEGNAAKYNPRARVRLFGLDALQISRSGHAAGGANADNSFFLPRRPSSINVDPR